MQAADYAAIISMAIMFLLVMWPMAPPHWKRGKKPPPKVEPKPQPKPEPEVPQVKHVTPRRPVVCSIELSAQQVFNAIADEAMERSGRDDLADLDWEITLYYTENKVKLKGAVIEFMDKNVKKRGKLWLVKG